MNSSSLLALQSIQRIVDPLIFVSNAPGFLFRMLTRSDPFLDAAMQSDPAILRKEIRPAAESFIEERNAYIYTLVAALSILNALDIDSVTYLSQIRDQFFRGFLSTAAANVRPTTISTATIPPASASVLNSPSSFASNNFS